MMKIETAKRRNGETARAAALAIWYLVSGIAATAATQHTLTLTLTNASGAATNGSDYITINGVTRWFTNNTASSPSTLILGTNNQLRAFTNLYNHFALYPWAGPLTIRTNGTNSLKLTAPIDNTIAFTVGGVWGEGATSIQAVAVIETTVTVPVTSKSALSRTNIASGLVEALQYASNKVGAAWVALDPLVTKTNGYSANQVLQSPILTNGLNYGNAFRSPGGGTGSEQIGSGSSASTNYSTALGFGTQATNLYSTALGSYAIAASNSAVAVGYAATAQNDNSIAIGSGTAATGLRSIAFGSSAESTHMDSICIGTSVTSTRSNEVRIGGLQDVVIGGLLSVDGQLTNNNARLTGGTLTNVAGAFSAATVTNLQAKGGNLTNVAGAFSGLTATNLQAQGGNLTDVAGTFNALTATNLQAHGGNLNNVSGGFSSLAATNLLAFGGTDTNRAYDRGFATNLTLHGANTLAAGGNLAIAASAITTIADGANVPDFTSNAYVRLNGTVTGPWSLAGVAGDLRNGRQIIIENRTGYSATVLHESGLAATAGNRINCLNDWTLGNAGMATFIYDSTASRWKVLSSRTAFPEFGSGYGAHMMNATNTVICTGASEVYTNIVGYNATSTNNFYGAPSLGALTNLSAGYYRVAFACSFLGANSTTYEFDIFTNSVACDLISSKEKTDSTARFRTSAGAGIIYLPASARVDLRIQDSGAGTSVNIHRASLLIGTP